MAMQETVPGLGSGASAARREAGTAGCLFHPVVDFLCLGGGSLIVFALLALFPPPESSHHSVAVAMLAIAFVINNPHFAHSYQIFYRNFSEKAFGGHYDPLLRLRYLFAGLVVPLALGAYLLGAVLLEDPRALGLFVNLMLFLVGWHYVKQGYGMLIVCSVLKRQFFDETEKRVLLVNAYLVWIADWLIANRAVHENDLWGLSYSTFDVPGALLTLGIGLAAGSTAATLWMLARKWWAAGCRLPVNGVLAYLVTLYAWLLLNVDVLFVLVVPACHSLQYLLVVWRYQLNADRDRAAQRRAAGGILGRAAGHAGTRFTAFLLGGILLGNLGFWGIPKLLGAAIPVDEAVFGPTLFMFLCFVFINVHHYFLDNVMWRRGNPDTGRYLFAHR